MIIWKSSSIFWNTSSILSSIVVFGVSLYRRCSGPSSLTLQPESMAYLLFLVIIISMTRTETERERKTLGEDTYESLREAGSWGQPHAQLHRKGTALGDSDRCKILGGWPFAGQVSLGRLIWSVFSACKKHNFVCMLGGHTSTMLRQYDTLMT